MSETQFYRKAEAAASQIVDAFRVGNLPKALAPVFIRRKDDTPCRRWSWANQLLVALRGYDDARGYRQWEQVGRHVKKGEKSFAILCPCIKKRKVTDENTGEEEERTFLYGFTSAAVFGLEQTEGDALPPPDPEVAAWLDSLPVRDVAESWGLTIKTFNGKGARCLGFYRPGNGIAVGVKNLLVWAHELVHAADDRRGAMKKRSGQEPSNEIVAEFGGAILLEMLGHSVESDRGGCWDYIRCYATKTKVEPITACMRLLNRACDAVALILDTAEAIRDESPEESVEAPTSSPPNPAVLEPVGVTAEHKTVENRNWPTKHRGRLAIHAGSRKGAEGQGYLDHIEQWREKGYEVPDVDQFQFGAILGTVELVDCVRFRGDQSMAFELLDSPFAFGPWCWVLEDPIWLPEPIPCRGQPGLWEFDQRL